MWVSTPQWYHKFSYDFFISLHSLLTAVQSFNSVVPGTDGLCSPLKPSGYCTYLQPGLTFTNSTFCPHSVFMCFVWISEQTAIISLYSINWPVFISVTECVYCAVRTGSLTIQTPSQWLLFVTRCLPFTSSTFCPHSVFMCFVWISEQTAIISRYSINWLAFITETECVYCAVRSESLNLTDVQFGLWVFTSLIEIWVHLTAIPCQPKTCLLLSKTRGACTQ
jgi:hypothetical protein